MELIRQRKDVSWVNIINLQKPFTDSIELRNSYDNNKQKNYRAHY